MYYFHMLKGGWGRINLRRKVRKYIIKKDNLASLKEETYRIWIACRKYTFLLNVLISTACQYFPNPILFLSASGLHTLSHSFSLLLVSLSLFFVQFGIWSILHTTEKQTEVLKHKSLRALFVICRQLFGKEKTRLRTARFMTITSRELKSE